MELRRRHHSSCYCSWGPGASRVRNCHTTSSLLENRHARPSSPASYTTPRNHDIPAAATPRTCSTAEAPAGAIHPRLHSIPYRSCTVSQVPRKGISHFAPAARVRAGTAVPSSSPRSGITTTAHLPPGATPVSSFPLHCGVSHRSADRVSQRELPFVEAAYPAHLPAASSRY